MINETFKTRIFEKLKTLKKHIKQFLILTLNFELLSAFYKENNFLYYRSTLMLPSSVR